MSIKNRYDFIMLFDVENGNPNGDPDAGNSPRIDSETGYGIITDVCLKRKIRNYIELIKEGEEGFQILIKQDKSLNSKFTEAYEKCGLEVNKKDKKENDEIIAQKYMCENYFDVRAFGAVMSTGDNPCGIVRGPVQISFARSISPINIQDITITRQAKTTEDRAKVGGSEMGKKSIVPYALYRAEGYISAALANKTTDLTEEDLEVLWNAIINMFEEDHSAARGKMCMRKLYVFKHENVLGNAPSNLLFDKITIKQNNFPAPARKFSDYTINVDNNLPDGVELIEKL